MPLDEFAAGLSPETMTRRLEGMVGCSLLVEADEDFVLTLVDMRNDGTLARLTTAQRRRLQALHDCHFAG